MRWIGFADAPPNKLCAGLLANAECQITHLLLIYRIREQARSHIDIA